MAGVGTLPELMQGPQVVRRQSSTTETSVTNSSLDGTTVQADWIGSPETSRLVRTAACCSGVPSSLREGDGEIDDEAKAIREVPRTITNRARTILGLRCERRRLIRLLPPSGLLVPYIGIQVPYKEG